MSKSANPFKTWSGKPIHPVVLVACAAVLYAAIKASIDKDWENAKFEWRKEGQ